MLCGPETAMFPEAKPRKTSTVEGPQNILLSRGLSQLMFCYIVYVLKYK